MFSRASEAHTSALRQTDDADGDDEPGEDEVREYADTIGIDVDNEPELMWIARAGITAPMPSDDWRPVETSTGDLYFFNFKTKESSWEHPSDEKYRKMVNEERKRLQIRQKPSQQAAPLPTTKKQSATTPNQVASQPPPPTTNQIRPLGRLTPLGSAPLNTPNQPPAAPGRLAPLAEPASKPNGGGSVPSRPSTSRGQRPSPSPTPTTQQQPQPNKSSPAKTPTPQSSKNPSPVAEVPVGFTLGGGSRFLKGNAPSTKQDQPTKINGAEVMTFTPHGERLNLMTDINSLDEDESDETESSTTESPLDLKANMNKPITVVQRLSPNPPKSVLLNKADRSDRSTSSISEKRVSFEMDLKDKEAEIRKDYDERLKKLKQEFEQQQKRQEAEMAASKRQLETTYAKQLEATKKQSEEKLSKELGALEANERAQLDQMEKDIANRRQILKDRFDRELNDDKADYESKLAKARREWKEKMAAEEAKLAAEFREVTLKEREAAKQRMTAAGQQGESVTNPIRVKTVDRAIATDPMPAPVAPSTSPPKLAPITRTPSMNAITQTSFEVKQTNNQINPVDGVASKLEAKLQELTTVTSALQSRMSELDVKAKMIAAEPLVASHRPSSNNNNKTGDDSLDDLVSLATNGTSIPERAPDNAADIVRRAKELLESPAKKSVVGEHELPIDSGFDRSVMSDRGPPLSTAAVVKTSLRQLQQDLQVLSTHLTGKREDTFESKNRALIDVDSFIDERWMSFSPDRVDHFTPYLPNRLRTTTTDTDNVEEKLADLKAWLSAFESHVARSKF